MQRPNRKRAKPNHFGVQDTNYNIFFDDDDTHEQNQLQSDSAHSDAPSSLIKSIQNHGTIDNGKCYELLKLLLKKTDTIENHLIKIDVKINHLDSKQLDTRKVIKLGNVDMDQLRQFGLPSDSEAELESLNTKMKTDIEFRGKLVSYFSIFS